MMNRHRLIALITCGLLIFSASVSPALAQEGGPTDADHELSVVTEFPVQMIGIGENVTFNLKLRTRTQAYVVGLEVEGLPEGWSASFKGKGRLVEAAFVEPGEGLSVDLKIEPPADVEPGRYRFRVIGRGESVEGQLPLELIIQEKTPAGLSLETELPTLRGKPSTTFRFNVTLKNTGDDDLMVDLFAEAPPSFRVTFKSGGNEVTSIPLEANGSKRLTVEADPLTSNVAASSYPITVQAQGGEASASTTLTAEVVGQSAMSLTTPDGRISGRAEAGSETLYKLILQNTGSAPAQGIKMSATEPNGWSVDFEPKEIERIEPGHEAEVTAKVKPAEKALAGDYMLTFRAQPESGPSESLEYRVTVRTSTLWGIVGIALIAVAVGAVGLAVTRFGRR